MTVWVTRNDGVVQDFTRSADHYIEHFDGSLEVIWGGQRRRKAIRPGATALRSTSWVVSGSTTTPKAMFRCWSTPSIWA